MTDCELLGCHLMGDGMGDGRCWWCGRPAVDAFSAPSGVASVQAASPPKNTSRWPHKCPKCGGKAYIGLTQVECATECGTKADPAAPLSGHPRLLRLPRQSNGEPHPFDDEPTQPLYPVWGPRP